MHFVTLLELLLIPVDSGGVCAVRLYVFIQVPAQILIHHTEHQDKVFVNVCPISGLPLQDT